MIKKTAGVCGVGGQQPQGGLGLRLGAVWMLRKSANKMRAEPSDINALKTLSRVTLRLYKRTSVSEPLFQTLLSKADRKVHSLSFKVSENKKSNIAQ